MTSATVQNAQARTSVSVGLNFGDRYDGPAPYWRSEPRVVMVPNTSVYYVSDSDYDVYRYDRYWYMNSDNRWYRSRSYRGPWIYVGYRSVPTQISYVPTQYRRHWRTFRDDNVRYSGYRTRRYDSRDINRDGRVDWRDRQNRDRDYRDRDMRDRDYRDRNGDGVVDWRDR
jgi:hypothetical protein